ncbi:MAG: glycosyltransferase family A protein [Leptolyngbyaceae bacterium]|nr:glycosyltransferase family A protein [Leptolyngbyaceae bacterium]
MIVFVIPLKSEKVSKSWGNVCRLFERCLQSVCHQTDPEFRVIVVCHEKPNVSVQHPHLQYLCVDFLPPGENIEQRRMDKAKKTIIGLRHAASFAPDHVMVVDADDCLSCRIAEFTNRHRQANGWFLNTGYVYQEKSPFIYFRKSHFHHWCGTCNIVRFDLWPIPENDDDYPSDLIDYYSGSNHRNIEKTLKSNGTPLEPFPLTGAAYVIGNGENIYQQGFSTIHGSNQGKPFFMLKELLKFRLLTPSIQQEFNLVSLQ